jgi:hypothetical protein
MTDDRHYPRPQLRRERWTSLNGPWRFAFDDPARWKKPGDVTAWTHEIRVPFAPESKRSGVHDQGFHRAVWYEREFDLDRASLGPGCARVLLHFGAVDYSATVWVNDVLVGRARGRPHAVHRRHHRRAGAGRAAARRGPRRTTTRTTSRSRAASRTGSSSRTRSGTRGPRASGRPSGSSACRRRTSATCAGPPTWSAGRSGSTRSSGRRATNAAAAVRLRSATPARRRHLRVMRGRGAPPHRALGPGHRRLPQRAALEARAPDADRRRAEL